MSDSYTERIEREGPLPGVDDDSELVGEEDENGTKGTGANAEGELPPVTLPAPGAGSYPVPAVSREELEEENAPADQEAER
jgi:hypothetical protein